MPFRVVIGSVKGLVYYLEVEIVKGEGPVFGVNEGHPIVTSGDFVA